MRRISILSFAFVIALVFGAVSYAYAGKHGHHMDKKEWWNKEEVVKELGLTSEQVTNIDDIDKSYDSKFESLHSDMMEAYKGFKETMMAPGSTDAQITEKHDEMLKVKNDLKKLKLEKKLRIRSVLKEDQITKLYEMKKSHWKGECRYGDKKCDSECKNRCEKYKDKKECMNKDK